VSLSVLVCRGCCCGTAKHPDVDHEAQVETLRRSLPDGTRARLFEVDCLGPCSRSNVVVVRRDGERRWFGQILDDEVTQALAGWVSDGAQEPPPALVARHEFAPEPRHRANVELVAAPSMR
jgi:predicted metal-binding protein